MVFPRAVYIFRLAPLQFNVKGKMSLANLHVEMSTLWLCVCVYLFMGKRERERGREGHTHICTRTPWQSHLIYQSYGYSDLMINLFCGVFCDVC